MADDLQRLMPLSLRGQGAIYHRMSAKARAHNAINLGQGYPELPGCQAIRDHAASRLQSGYQQYTDPKGPEPLRLALARDALARYGRTLDANTEVTIAHGAQGALGAALLGLLSPGDEVVFIEPYYHPMIPIAHRAGATPKYISLEGEGFHLREKALRAQMSERTKLIVYNSPNNPSGHVFRREELMSVARACQDFDAYLIADEVYEHVAFDEHTHISALEIPELTDRAMIISSFSKTYLMTGWRVGWALGHAPLVAGLRRAHALQSFCVADFLAEGARFAIEDLPASYLIDFRADMKARRDRLRDGLTSLGLRTLPCEGAIYLALDISELDVGDDLEFCERMPEEIGVAGIPMSLSWNERRHGRNWVRLCFAKSDDLIDGAIDAFGRWMKTR